MSPLCQHLTFLEVDRTIPIIDSIGVGGGEAAPELVVDAETLQRHGLLQALAQRRRRARKRVRQLARQRAQTFERDGVIGQLPGGPQAPLEGASTKQISARLGLTDKTVPNHVSRILTKAGALSAYRIVQEAQTNTLKHAGGAHVAVHIAYVESSQDKAEPAIGPAAAAQSHCERPLGRRSDRIRTAESPETRLKRALTCLLPFPAYLGWTPSRPRCRIDCPQNM